MKAFFMLWKALAVDRITNKSRFVDTVLVETEERGGVLCLTKMIGQRTRIDCELWHFVIAHFWIIINRLYE